MKRIARTFTSSFKVIIYGGCNLNRIFISFPFTCTIKLLKPHYFWKETRSSLWKSALMRKERVDINKDLMCNVFTFRNSNLLWLCLNQIQCLNIFTSNTNSSLCTACVRSWKTLKRIVWSRILTFVPVNKAKTFSTKLHNPCSTVQSKNKCWRVYSTST